MSVEDPMFRDMQEYNRERDERDNERADRKHRPPATEPKCSKCGDKGFVIVPTGVSLSNTKECDWCYKFSRKDRPPTTEPAEIEGKWKPTEEMIARDIAFHGECFAVDYGTASDYDDAFAEKMREREKWYNAGWQGRKRYEAEQGEKDADQS